MPVERHRAAEQPLARLRRRRAGRRAARRRVTPGHLELDRVDVRIAARRRWSNVSTDCWPKRARDRVGDRRAARRRSTRSTSKRARALEGRRARGRRRRTRRRAAASRAARPPPSRDDPRRPSRAKRPQPIVEPRVGGVGDHRGVVGGEDLGVGERGAARAPAGAARASAAATAAAASAGITWGGERWFVMTRDSPPPGVARASAGAAQLCAAGYRCVPTSATGCSPQRCGPPCPRCR